MKNPGTSQGMQDYFGAKSANWLAWLSELPTSFPVSSTRYQEPWNEDETESLHCRADKMKKDSNWLHMLCLFETMKYSPWFSLELR